MKRFFAMFVLTPGEQRVIIFIVLALVIGAFIKNHREMSVERSVTPIVSPTPDKLLM